MFQACTTAALNYIDVAKGVASIYSDLHASRGWKEQSNTEFVSRSDTQPCKECGM